MEPALAALDRQRGGRGAGSCPPRRSPRSWYPKLVRVFAVNVSEALREDYVRLALASGAGRAAVLWRHAVPNALLGTTALIGTPVRLPDVGQPDHRGDLRLAGVRPAADHLGPDARFPGGPGRGLRDRRPGLRGQCRYRRRLSPESTLACAGDADERRRPLGRPRRRRFGRPPAAVALRPRAGVGGCAPGRRAGPATGCWPLDWGSPSFLAAAAVWVALAPPVGAERGSLLMRLKPPGTDGAWLGTDQLGRDLWARVLAGLPWSLGIALAASLIATLLGAAVGAGGGLVSGPDPPAVEPEHRHGDRLPVPGPGGDGDRAGRARLLAAGDHPRPRHLADRGARRLCRGAERDRARLRRRGPACWASATGRSWSATCCRRCARR